MTCREVDTCDSGVLSWVDSANVADCDFPLQNLPLGVVRDRRAGGPWQVGVAIGRCVLDVCRCADQGLLASSNAALRSAVGKSTLNEILALGADGLRMLRLDVHNLLRADADSATQDAVAALLTPLHDCEHAVPAAIGTYVDFFASAFHARNVVTLRDPDAPLYPHFGHAPLAYHGRASSLVISGTPISRPSGPRRGPTGVVFAPTERLDYEVELALVASAASTLGVPVPPSHARSHIAGVCLMNDWSARDIQAFESQPLGPFLSKSFATTISPWMITLDALEPFRVAASERPRGIDPALPHLVDDDDQARGALDITIECRLTSRLMRERAVPPLLLCRTNARTLLWTPAQLVTHLTSNGSPLRPGDLLGTGTVSGADRDSLGCLLERTRGGRDPFSLPTGESRGYLQDDDEVTMTAHCSGPGAVRIGFGECRGRVVAASAAGSSAGL